MPTLLIDNGRDRVGGTFYGPLLIGRRAANAVVVDDPHVDLVHAWISSGPAGYFVANIAPRGQTLLNGQPVSGRQTLNDGDVIEIGSALHITYRTDTSLPAGYRPTELLWRGQQVPNVDEPVVFPCVCGTMIALTPVFSGTMSRCPTCGRVVDVPFESVRPPEPIPEQPPAEPTYPIAPEPPTPPTPTSRATPAPTPTAPAPTAPAPIEQVPVVNARVEPAPVEQAPIQPSPSQPPPMQIPLVVHAVAPVPPIVARFSQTEIVEEPLDDQPTHRRKIPVFESLASDALSMREHAFDLSDEPTESVEDESAAPEVVVDEPPVAEAPVDAPDSIDPFVEEPPRDHSLTPPVLPAPDAEAPAAEAPPPVAEPDARTNTRTRAGASLRHL